MAGRRLPPLGHGAGAGHLPKETMPAGAFTLLPPGISGGRM